MEKVVSRKEIDVNENNLLETGTVFVELRKRFRYVEMTRVAFFLVKRMQTNM